ncbi:G-alpha-domain-containing protein [Pluteus cervinus]|uniref:G-alpha-domain-containing protein n=1 Tax=Pluteus cervinus TaxID=181527 RepID=A0ACD3APT3_9AGAR|nr:G-alpha-domain-containing protein [Pluteus cervinus]
MAVVPTSCSDAIDKQIEDHKKHKRRCKLLLLGPGDSEKTTVVKQMKIIHQGGFSSTDLVEWRPVVYKNVLESAKAVVMYMRKIAHAIHQVWKDPVVSKILDQQTSEFYLMDSAGVYFPSVSVIYFFRIILMFAFGRQRSEWKKWIHSFESVTSIILCTSLSEYTLLSDLSCTRLDPVRQIGMLESLLSFESVINSRWFLRTSIMLFLNKVSFPEYTGGTDINRAAKYILCRFMQVNRARLCVYPQCATDTNSIRLVFAAVRDTIPLDRLSRLFNAR